MEEKKMDRRVRYTHMMLRDALVEMLRKEHISKISVKALCDLADINRSTFYAHFKDQYDLLHYIEQEATDNIKNYLEKQDFSDRLPVSLQTLNRILEYVKENADLFRALISDNCEPSIQIEIMNLTQVFPIPLYKEWNERTKDYITVFGITGCVSILQKWLEDGMPESTMEISEFILQLLYQGIASFQLE